MQDVHLLGVVVTYNRLSDLKITVARSLAQSFDQLVVVDNASTDGTAEYLHQQTQLHPKRLQVIQLPENLGGAGGFHHGLAHVASIHASGTLPAQSWCVLFDDDAYPEAGCVDAFRARISTYPQVAAVAATVLDGQGGLAEVNRPILNIFRDPRHLMFVLREGGVQGMRDLYHVPKSVLLEQGARCSVDAISFVGLFLNLGRLASAGYPLPDPDLFIYSDDTLYTAQLQRRGDLLLQDSDLRFVHNTQTGYADGLIHPIWKLFYLLRNSWYVYRELGGWCFGPLLFGVGLAAKLRICGRYPRRAERRMARRMLRLALHDLARQRRRRRLADVMAVMNA